MTFTLHYSANILVCHLCSVPVVAYEDCSASLFHTTEMWQLLVETKFVLSVSTICMLTCKYRYFLKFQSPVKETSN